MLLPVVLSPQHLMLCSGNWNYTLVLIFIHKFIAVSQEAFLFKCIHTHMHIYMFKEEANPFTPQGAAGLGGAAVSLLDYLAVCSSFCLPPCFTSHSPSKPNLFSSAPKSFHFYMNEVPILCHIDQIVPIYLARVVHYYLLYNIEPVLFFFLFFSLSLCCFKWARLFFTLSPFCSNPNSRSVSACVFVWVWVRKRERESILFLAGWGSLGSQAYGKSALGKSWTEAFHYAVLSKHTQTYRPVFVTEEDIALTYYFSLKSKP